MMTKCHHSRWPAQHNQRVSHVQPAYSLSDVEPAPEAGASRWQAAHGPRRAQRRALALRPAHAAQDHPRAAGLRQRPRHPQLRVGRIRHALWHAAHPGPLGRARPGGLDRLERRRHRRPPSRRRGHGRGRLGIHRPRLPPARPRRRGRRGGPRHPGVGQDRRLHRHGAARLARPGLARKRRHPRHPEGGGPRLRVRLGGRRPAVLDDHQARPLDRHALQPGDQRQRPLRRGETQLAGDLRAPQGDPRHL